MRLEEGKYYRTRDGRKAGPVRRIDGEWNAANAQDGNWRYDDDGGLTNFGGDDLDLIAEWTEGPVRTVTRREVVEGVYGRLKVNQTYATEPSVGIKLVDRNGKELGESGAGMTSTELKAAAAVLLELAGALDSE